MIVTDYRALEHVLKWGHGGYGHVWNGVKLQLRRCLCAPKTYCSWVSEGKSDERGVKVHCHVVGDYWAVEREPKVRPLLTGGAVAGVHAGVSREERGLCGGMPWRPVGRVWYCSEASRRKNKWAVLTMHDDAQHNKW